MATDFYHTPPPDDEALAEPETVESGNGPAASLPTSDTDTPDAWASGPSSGPDAGTLLAGGLRSAADGAFDTDALRRLFHSPFFHQRDGLDDYDEDYDQSSLGEETLEALARLARKRQQTVQDRKMPESDHAPEKRPFNDEAAPADRPPASAKRSPAARRDTERAVGPFLYRPDRCARSLGKVEGCRRCEAICPTGAVSFGHDGPDIDPHTCETCGICIATCPSGAIHTPMDPSGMLLWAAREWMEEHRQEHGARLLRLNCRPTTAPPAPEEKDGCLCIDLSEPGYIGAETFLALLAVGFEAVRLHFPEGYPEAHLTAIIRQVHLTDEIAHVVGFPRRSISLDRGGEGPEAEHRRPGERRMPRSHPPDITGDRRDLLRWALAALTDPAHATPDPVTLQLGAPFGTLTVAAEGCTLCMACIGLCTTGALAGGGGTPRITFAEAACIQCGRCASGCPEGAVTLFPKFDAGGQLTRRQQVVAEETPLPCIRCGAPFATRKMIDTITARLAGTPMFATDTQKRRLRMCADCRLRDRFESPPDRQ